MHSIHVTILDNKTWLYYQVKFKMQTADHIIKRFQSFMAVICLLLVSFCLSSCDKNDLLKQKYIKMQHEKVNIPIDAMRCLRSSISNLGEEKYRFIIYMNSTVCVPCAIRGLATWTPIINELNDNKDVISLYIIVETKEQELIDKIEFYTPKERTNVYIDTANVFKRMNPNIPDETLFHQFLLNREDSVILIGDPVSNEKIFDLVNETIHGKF